uniref:Uncharacterized protein n=1 Tax=Triticum urartu TaxID=4572 RepID=A0A8R7UAP0_TRIUA
MGWIYEYLEAFPVDDGWSGFVVLGLGDPHLLEGAEGGEDGASDPHTVLPLGRGDDLDLHGAGREGGDLLAHPVGDAGEHGGATTEDDVAVEVLPDVHITLHDGVVGGLVDPRGFHPDEGWLEEHLRAAEALGADGDDLAVGQLVALLHGGAGLGGLHLLVVVEGDVGELLLHVADDFALRRGGEGVAALREDLHEVVAHQRLDVLAVGHLRSLLLPPPLLLLILVCGCFLDLTQGSTSF